MTSRFLLEGGGGGEKHAGMVFIEEECAILT